ncbi:MAG: EpsG family protein [Lachnospiraceae bacterium]|nr:EpsG family protein [Lachnospiraceae bacterium]
MVLYMVITGLTLCLAGLVKNTCNGAGTVSTGNAGNRGNSADGLYERSCITRQNAVNYASMMIIFTILFLLSAFRLDVGNDYGTYVDTFHEIYVGGYVVTEPFFNGLIKVLFFLSGGEDYLLAFALFGFVTIWLFLKVLYEQSDDFFLAFFLFMTLGLYFRTFNTIRYYFVLAVTLYSFRYVLRREYLKFLALIGFAAMFHKSVLVVIPLYLLAGLTWKKWHVAALGAGGISLLLFRDFFLKIALLLYPSYENTIYVENIEGITGSLFNIARCVAVLVLALLVYKEAVEKHEANLFYFKLNLLAIFVYVCCSFLPLVTRFGYYLMTSHILFLPSLSGQIRDPRKKKLVTAAILLAGIIYFAYFLKTGNQVGVRVLPYISWLFEERYFPNAGEIF